MELRWEEIWNACCVLMGMHLGKWPFGDWDRVEALMDLIGIDFCSGHDPVVRHVVAVLKLGVLLPLECILVITWMWCAEERHSSKRVLMYWVVLSRGIGACCLIFKFTVHKLFLPMNQPSHLQTHVLSLHRVSCVQFLMVPMWVHSAGISDAAAMLVLLTEGN
jgi:hypothetical protein